MVTDQPSLFVATNIGVLVHDFGIEPAGSVEAPLENNGVQAQIEAIQAGGSGEFEWTFSEPCSDQFACHVPGHVEAGMVLAFEVVAP